MGREEKLKSPRKLFRIANRTFPNFDGGGAEQFGARWNSLGRKVIYCSGSVACCRLEIIVNSAGLDVPNNLDCIEIAVPSDIDITTFKIDELPSNWNNPSDYSAAQNIGDKWYDRGASLLLEVPSAVSPEDSNYLINQSHRDIALLEVSKPWPVEWDERLFKRGQ